MIVVNWSGGMFTPLDIGRGKRQGGKIRGDCSWDLQDDVSFDSIAVSSRKSSVVPCVSSFVHGDPGEPCESQRAREFHRPFLDCDLLEVVPLVLQCPVPPPFRAASMCRQNVHVDQTTPRSWPGRQDVHVDQTTPRSWSGV